MKEVTPAALRAHALPEHTAGSKEQRGTLLIVGGSRETSGGALLAGTAALRAGLGRLQIATVASVAPMLGLAVPEAAVAGLPETESGEIDPDAAGKLAERAAKVDAVLIGPGMSADPSAEALTSGLLQACDVPVVIDAGALRGLPGLGRPPRSCIISPHAGEMAHLLEEEREAIEADPEAAARRAAERFGCVAVMKGEQTHIVGADGEPWLFRGGTIGLATSGSGDVLAGVIAAVLARGLEPLWAAIWGVALHGGAGARVTERLGGIGLLARELPAELPGLMAELSRADGS